MELNPERSKKLMREIAEMERMRPMVPPLITDKVSPYACEDALIHIANRRAINNYLSLLKGEYKWRAGRDLAMQMRARDTAVLGRDTKKRYIRDRALARRADMFGLAYEESGSAMSSFLRKQKDLLYPIAR